MDEATFNCPHCRALYTVTVGQRAAIVGGSAHCQVCGREMMRWRTPSPPTFRLVDKGEGRSKPTA